VLVDGPNVADHSPQPALIGACQKNQEEFVDLLLSHGADPNILDGVFPL